MWEDPCSNCRWCGVTFQRWLGLQIHVEHDTCINRDLRHTALQSTDLAALKTSIFAAGSTHCVLRGRWFKFSRTLSKHFSVHEEETKRGKADYANLHLQASWCCGSAFRDAGKIAGNTCCIIVRCSCSQALLAQMRNVCGRSPSPVHECKIGKSTRQEESEGW